MGLYSELFSLPVSNEMLAYCYAMNERVNLGLRSHSNGNKEQQFTGLVGENMVRYLFGFPLMNIYQTVDNGHDIIIDDVKIDVKTMGRNTNPLPHYVNNLIAAQINRDSEVYLFASFNKKNTVLTITGWIDKGTFIDRADFYDAGYMRVRDDGSIFESKTDLYEIQNKDLFQFYSPELFLTNIKSKQWRNRTMF